MSDHEMKLCLLLISNTFMFIDFVWFSVYLSNVLDEGKLYFAVWSEKVSLP